MNTKQIHFNLRRLWQPSKLVRILWLSLLLCSVGQPIAKAQDHPQAVSRIRRVYTTRWRMSNPGSVAYATGKGLYFMAGATASSDRTQLLTISTDEELVERTTVDFAMQDTSNLAVDESSSRLLLLDGSQQEIAQIGITADNQLDLANLTRFNVTHWGLQKPTGMMVDAANGQLLILDGATAHVIVTSLSNGFDPAVAPLASIDLTGLGAADLRGLAVHPQSGNLFVMSFSQQIVFEVNPAGELVNRYTLADMGLLNPSSITLAATADPTDDPAEVSLLVADQGFRQAQQPQESEAFVQLFLPWLTRDNAGEMAQSNLIDEESIPDLAPNLDPGEIIDTDGKLVEISLSAPLASVSAAAVHLTLVNTTLTSNFGPPSTDPAGIANLPNPRNRMLLVDSEVDEGNHFRGSNLFEMKRSGAFTRAGNTLTYSREPTGADYNSTNGKLYISDDNADAIFEVTAGADGNFGTGDDTSRKIDLKRFALEDAEGVAISPPNNLLFIIDGLSREIFRIHPGPNGILGDADDFGLHFDTAALGISDPEGIDLNAAGNLFVTGDNDHIIFEVSTAGKLVQTYDITPVRGFHLAGLSVAPASNNSGRTNLYVADRGKDNQADPNENDGRVFEFSFP